MYTYVVHVTLTLHRALSHKFQSNAHLSTSFSADSMRNKTREIRSHERLDRTLSVCHDPDRVSSPRTYWTLCPFRITEPIKQRIRHLDSCLTSPLFAEDQGAR